MALHHDPYTDTYHTTCSYGHPYKVPASALYAGQVPMCPQCLAIQQQAQMAAQMQAQAQWSQTSYTTNVTSAAAQSQILAGAYGVGAVGAPVTKRERTPHEWLDAEIDSVRQLAFA